MPVGLFLGEQAIDVIGQVGENPGDGWIVGDDAFTRPYLGEKTTQPSKGTADWGDSVSQWDVYPTRHLRNHRTPYHNLWGRKLQRTRFRL